MVGDVADNAVGVETGHPPTMHTGPLGSTIHVIRADAGTVAELAAIDWTRSFRRVCLDPARGLIILMAPSRLHDELATILDNVVDVAASALRGAVKGLRTARLREPGAPPGTGMEPDGAFYVGERARSYRAALAAGKEAADAFFEENAPDLVVEVEVTNADEGKIDRYAPIWACASSGCSTVERVPNSRESRSSLFSPGRRLGGSPPRTYSRTSRRTTSRTRWAACASA